ncbi:MAG TPA: ergothioneine biosynthesis protein EgtC [Aldersonia sp.]
MCRHLGYLGPPVPVSEPVLHGPHSLRTQAWAPREMRGGGTINADGFGIAWWRSSIATGYRNPMPIWTDPAVDDVLGQLCTTAVLAAVRSATLGMPIDRASCAPFIRGPWAFSHNGVVPDWRKTIGSVLKGVDGLGGVDAATLLELETATDSAALWLALAARLEAADPASALRGLVTDVLRAAPDARLNLLLGDGQRLWATTCYHSLYVLASENDTAAAVVIASEPYDDDPRWQPVPDRRLVVARPGELTIEPI